MNSKFSSRRLYMLKPVISDAVTSGVNCARRKSSPGGLRESRGEGRLSDAGNVLDQNVSAGEHRRYQKQHFAVLADDDLLDLGREP